MEQQEKFDYEELKRKTLEQLRSGKSLFGKDGAFAPLLKDILEAALEGEMEAYLDDEQRANGNRKNGKNRKRLKTADGTIDLETPRDRASSFEPQIIKKRETILAESLENKIIGMYGHGMSLRDISAHIKDMYDTEISAATLSSITDKIIPLVKEWQARPLEPLYCIIWLDAMFYKVKEEGKIVNRCVYNIVGINAEGRKELLGMYISESEGANFWLSVLANLQQRGVSDILIACIDNLKGFSEAIATIFPFTAVQTCIVHQVRNSIRYIASKDQKPFMADLKPVYQAVSKEEAESRLEQLDQKWGKKYPVVIDSWHRNWDKLSTYFQYSDAIRRLIYTTNTIEGFHRQVRKVTKTKGAFTSDMALLKLIFLAAQNIQKKWTQPLPNWSLTVSQLSIIFGERLKLRL
ncbi:Transposase (or an inactivated derivative) [Chitinophaga terrae (ex Kim and Jung 2007)]|uniref:Mutator family transposase n=3 Tax=Chitinophaga terrae (ex Kim and Jung 2007) TaxID=408074 RepID=A0A1H4GSH2_9BACT|nr:IS256 family transposase [Chitinophaga terrae (ex Kim and Jung 2007)]SEB12271.1 Transposase (or an inactivated derivative) [Chitinophaga terrae (ex Kim and Jung 2007)]